MKLSLIPLIFFFLANTYGNELKRNFLFYCTDGQQGYDLLLKTDKSLIANAKNSQDKWSGTYKLTKNLLTLSIPLLNFNEEARNLEWRQNFLITFQGNFIKCHLVGHDQGKLVTGYTKCPTIKYIPGISYQDNAFVFYSHGMVKRRSWKELLKVPDTLYGESYGIYYIEGTKIYMYFGDRKDERYLTGQLINDSSFTIDQLEPEKGACAAE